MSDQVSTDLQTIQSALSDLSNQISSISSELQTLKNGTSAGVALTDEQVALIHTLAQNAQQVDNSAKALVPSTDTASTPVDATGSDTVSGATSDQPQG